MKGDYHDYDTHDRARRGVSMGIVAAVIILLVLIGIVVFLIFNVSPEDSRENHPGLGPTSSRDIEVIKDGEVTESPKTSIDALNALIAETNAVESQGTQGTETTVSNLTTPFETLPSAPADNSIETLSPSSIEEPIIADTSEPPEAEEELPEEVRLGVYQVSEGETLQSVAAKLSLPEESILSVNNLGDNRNIEIGGRIIQIPSAPVMQYIVEKDDTLESIIEKNDLDISINGLRALNGSRVNRLEVGTIMYIPYERESSVAERDLRQPISGTVSKQFGDHFGARVLEGVIIKGSIAESVYAPGDGTVIASGKDRSLGTYITIELEGGLEATLYGLEYVDPQIKVGDEVKKGQGIGSVGPTDYGLERSSLYIVTRKNGKAIDPLPLFSSS